MQFDIDLVMKCWLIKYLSVYLEYWLGTPRHVSQCNILQDYDYSAESLIVDRVD